MPLGGLVPRRLPPLHTLRAFEAAARNLSFTGAAEELNVTQSAVSQQIRQLEDQVGVPLFRRLTRGLALTDEGRLLLPVVRDSFDRLGAAFDLLHSGEMQRVLVVSVLSSFASKWLVPRLGRFRRLHPQIEISLYPSPAVPDFARADVDVAILWGDGEWPGLKVTKFLDEEIFPVCAPALRDGKPPLRAPADLRRHTLLRSATHDFWRHWLDAAGLPDVTPGQGPVFDDSSMMIEAAVDGLGVGLARGALAADDLAAGRLVKPFKPALPSPLAYYLVCPEGAAQRPKIASFRQWLLAEAGATMAPAKARTKSKRKL